jgi:type 1 glutamine amidotransferase
MTAHTRRTFLNAGLAAVPALLHAWSLPAAASAQARPPVPRPPIAMLVCGTGTGRDHDFDLARRHVLDALYAIEGFYTDAVTDYSTVDTLGPGDLLVSYTSLVSSTPDQMQAVRRFLEGGGRWFAMHATNYVAKESTLPDVLGSRFITHPPFGHFSVTIDKPGDPLLAGIQPFEVDDELYVIEHSPDIEVLLSTRWGGTALGNQQVPEGYRPLMYKRRVGAGGVLYLALGHSNRRFGPARTDIPGDQPVRAGMWGTPVHRELVKRGLEWAAQRRPL